MLMKSRFIEALHTLTNKVIAEQKAMQLWNILLSADNIMKCSAAVADLEVEAGARLDAAAGTFDTCPDQTVHETTHACSRTILDPPGPNLSHSFKVYAAPDHPGVVLPNSFFQVDVPPREVAAAHRPRVDNTGCEEAPTKGAAGSPTRNRQTMHPGPYTAPGAASIPGRPGAYHAEMGGSESLGT